MNPFQIRKQTSESTASIKKVIFNPPATIVLWNDATKTVVKAQDDEPFDPEKGLAMAIAKKYLGNKGSYFNQIKKWTENFKDPRAEFLEKNLNFKMNDNDIQHAANVAANAMKDVAEWMRKRFNNKVDRGV